MADGHVPVLLQETLEWLAPAPGETFLDGTVGAGGHAAEIAARVGPAGRVVCADADPAMLRMAADRLRDFPWVRPVQADFSDLGRLVEEAGGKRFDGILLDLGISSQQLDDPSRGFSFRGDGPLDMRRDPGSRGADAREILRRAGEKELAEIFFRFGEERFSRRIARAIVARRRREPLERTSQLAELVLSVVPRKAWPRKIHPATRVFQALRIAVNHELESLSLFLDRFVPCLAPGGRVAVISFHSLEDRLVKRTFRTMSTGSAAPLAVSTRKPVVPGEEEIGRNPRAASAKLRAARRIGEEERT
ncbi:MAG TPA: 16S rRNA (cytosine(1402)-N(4))-methyltransferase [Deltaproteobacteria bacterium]|nr:MAG: 16S rRNA (cytosine(1402)-N(4))-methyltransferase [Deltaproteobacteria bacterium GWC2_65_14]HBO70643.1 16S rRNA (cytosine(1402)-N(4))-methyltransferase [Deltaproteobacteria bacterium]